MTGADSVRPGSSGDGDAIGVLHVEDDRAFAELTAIRLERDGRPDADGPDRDAADQPIRVETVTDPTAALDRVESVDCVVSDYDLPGMDGLELLDAIRDRGHSLPFVLFTGRGNEEIASRAISAGVTDYIRKGGGSERFDVLANRVRNAVACTRAQRRAERGEARLRRVVDFLPQSLFVKDEDGRYLLVNEAGGAQHGYLPDELEGRSDGDVYPAEQVARFRAEDWTVTTSGEPMDVPTRRNRTAGGSERIERVREIPFELARTDKRAVLGITTDVTDARDPTDRFERVGERVRAAEGTLESLDAALAADDDADAAVVRERLAALLAEARELSPGEGDRRAKATREADD